MLILESLFYLFVAYMLIGAATSIVFLKYEFEYFEKDLDRLHNGEFILFFLLLIVALTWPYYVYANIKLGVKIWLRVFKMKEANYHMKRLLEISESMKK